MKNQKKRPALFTPVIILFCVLFAAVLGYGVARYFLLSSGGFDADALYRTLFETIPALAVLLLLCVALPILLHRLVSSPVRKLTRAVKGLSERALKGQPPVAVKARGICGALADAVTVQEKEIVSAVESARKKAEEDTEARVSLSHAREICRLTVPEKTTFGGLTYGVSAETRQCAAVGADFCQAFPMDKGRIFFAVGDVWGEGLPAALFLAKLKGLLDRYVPACKALSEAMGAVNAELIENNRDLLAASLFIAVFTPETGELRYVNAGHLPPIIAGEKIGFLRMRAGAPLGVYPGAAFQEEIFYLTPGQGLFLHTEGLTAARNEKGEFFGYDRLFKCVRVLFENGMSAESVTSGVEKAVNTFCKDAEQICDRTMLALYYPNGVQRLFRPDLSETENLRGLIFDWLDADPRKKKISTACEEIFANIVAHAGAKTIQLSCEKDDGNLILRFTDDGEPFDPLQPADDRDLYPYGEEEKGITIIRRLGGEMFYRTKQNLNVLTLRFPLIRGL